MQKPKKVVMIGLDGLNPDLVYQWKGELPNLSKLMEEGALFLPLRPKLGVVYLPAKTPDILAIGTLLTETTTLMDSLNL